MSGVRVKRRLRLGRILWGVGLRLRLRLRLSRSRSRSRRKRSAREGLGFLLFLLKPRRRRGHREKHSLTPWLRGLFRKNDKDAVAVAEKDLLEGELRV